MTPGASSRQVERAFRDAVRRTHPDRFPPGSEAWEDASEALRSLTEARAAWYAGDAAATDGPDSAAGVRVAGRTAAGDRWAWAEDAPRHPDWSFDEERILRRRRIWGLSWGGFLLASAAVSLLVGARDGSNLALPLWAPALALTGILALVLGWWAHRSMRD